MLQARRESYIRPFEFGRRFDIEELPEQDQAEQLEREEQQREKAERDLAEREAQVAVAKAEGYEAGHAAAKTEIEAEMTRVGSVLADRLDAAFSSAETIYQRITDDAIELALAIGKGLAGELMRDDPLGCAEQAIANALAEQIDRPRLIVKTAPSDLRALESFVEKHAEEVRYEGRIMVQDDQNLSPGDCIIEWADGGMRAINDERVARVSGEIAGLLAAHKKAR